MTTTENVQKKAVRLEDKLAEAEVKLAEARKALASAEATIADELAAAKRKEKEVSDLRNDARRSYDQLRKETVSRLGLTPAAAKKAVLAWAGLAPNEETEALVRGETQTLDKAIANVISGTIARDPAIKFAIAQLDQLWKVESAAQDDRRRIEHKTREPEQLVHRFEYEIRELREKIAARDRAKATKAPAASVPVISNADKARFIEARRRLTAAAAALNRSWNNGTDDKPIKLEPPFVWPPKEK